MDDLHRHRVERANASEEVIFTDTGALSLPGAIGLDTESIVMGKCMRLTPRSVQNLTGTLVTKSCNPIRRR
jgi:hypothetical protein